MEITKDNVMIARPLERLIEVGLGDVFLNVLKSYEDRILEIDANTGEELKANVLVNQAILLAKWFQKIGIGVGDSVSISSENRLEFCVVPIACFITGATFAPLNPEYTPGELRHVISLSKPKVVFCSPQTLESVTKIFPEHPFIHHLVIFSQTNSMSYIPGCTITLHDDIVKGAESMPIDEDFQATPIDPYETVATILCSSGTTGMPKGVMTTHNNMTAYIEISRQIVPEIMQPESDQEVIMGLAPFFHSMGFMVMMLNLLGGKKFIIQGRFHPRKFLENIAKYKIVTIIASPPVILFLTKHPLVRNYDVSSIKHLRSGAAPLSREIEMTAKKRLNLKVMTQGYGMTETTLGVCMSIMDQGRVGSVGKLVPGMCAKVIDENGKALGPNEVGELCFKGPLIMKGYINNPKATAETIATDGFLHTGDVGYYDKDGFFFVVDRLKELIKYKAFQVPPAELEAILISHPAVEDVGVIGIPNDEVGELATAFVVRKKGRKVTARELQELVKAKVSRQKQLHGGVRFVESIPRNPTGKILRRVLRQNAEQIKSKL